ncbi:MAG: ATPase [Chitinophagaceae bacterium]|nr:MAG: ATPase [Chitinophagaceae bacterium]
MEKKTKVSASEGKQEIIITRDFDLPVDLLFKAYVEPDIVQQWMGTKVLLLENKPHGSWRFETSDPSGNVVFRANGVMHEFVPGRKITRTFEMEGTPFPVQLEFLVFESTGDGTSTLTMHIIFRSVADRDLLLQMPFASGINMAHNRLQGVLSNK